MLDPNAERYVSLATFRKDGSEIATPVWIAGADDDAFVFTNARSYKVKRIRNNGKARLAPCKSRGEVTGPYTDATAKMVDDPTVKDRAIRALVGKYGWQMRLFLIYYKLTGRQDEMAVVKIDFVEADS